MADLKPKVPLDHLFAFLDTEDDDMDSTALAAQLRSRGIDVAEADRVITQSITSVVAATKRRRLDRARHERIVEGSSRWLPEVQRRRYTEETLRRKIASFTADVGHRELNSQRRLDLESQLADLIELHDGASILDEP